MMTSSDFEDESKNECDIYKSHQSRKLDKETSMDSNTKIKVIGPQTSTTETKLWQSVHDYLDDPPPISVLLRNPWKWLNSRARNKNQNP